MHGITIAYIDFTIRNSIYLSLIIFLLGLNMLSQAIDSDVIFGCVIGVATGFIYSIISHLIVLRGAFYNTLLNVFSRGWFPVMSLRQAILIFVGVIYEEIVWRVYILSAMEAEYQILGLWVTCVFFYLIHFSVFKIDSKLRTIELFLFSIIICFLWVHTKNLYAVFLFHYIRNHISMNLILYHSVKDGVKV